MSTRAAVTAIDKAWRDSPDGDHNFRRQVREILAGEEAPAPDVAPATHFLEVASVGLNGEPRLDLVCTAAPGSLCRMRPTDGRDYFNADADDLVDSGTCTHVEWVENVGLAEIVSVVGKDVRLARIPVDVQGSEDGGVECTPVAPQPTLPIDVPAAERRRQRIAVLGSTYADAGAVAAYLPREADVILLSAHTPNPYAEGHGEAADALLITTAAFEMEPKRLERILPSLKPIVATRKLPEPTAGGAA